MTDAEVGRTRYVAELQCFLCGSLAGSIETDRAPLPAHGIWRPAGGGPPQRVADWRQLHCRRCGGALYAESIEAVVDQDEEDDDLRQDTPRRGRPPKWLIEQRRRERESA
jgi:hypothetical protein